MNNGKIYSLNVRIVSEIVLGVVFLMYGCAIYLLFRSKSLYIYQWCHSLGFANTIDALRKHVQNWDVSDFVKFSLPDGLYSAAYLLIIDAIWHNDSRAVKYFILSLVPFVTISSELLQYVGLVKGTFDIHDLICYLIPPTIYIICIYNHKKYNKLKTEKVLFNYGSYGNLCHWFCCIR